MKQYVLAALTTISTSIFALTANADVLYEYISSGTYGQATVFSNGNYASINVSVDGLATDQTVHLSTYYHLPGEGYHFWSGEIPASAVTVAGVDSIAVDINTCDVNNTTGCGPVDVTVTKDPHGGGFITDGSSQYQWDDLIFAVAGPVQVHSATVTGTVNGVPLDNGRGYIGKYNQAHIEVQTGS
ncbi:MAG: hypothetical protein PVJ39_07655 [Gammaproteobacteria bacterium]